MELAIYAALIGTVSLGILFYKLWRERRNLEITLYPAWPDGTYVRGGARFTNLSFEVLNTGPTPVVLRGVGAEGKRCQPLPEGVGGTLSSAILNDEGLPKQLDPGHTYRGLAPLPAGVLSGELVISDIWAEDSLGRQYRPPRQRRQDVTAEVEASLKKRAAS